MTETYQEKRKHRSMTRYTTRRYTRCCTWLGAAGEPTPTAGEENSPISLGQYHSSQACRVPILLTCAIPRPKPMMKRPTMKSATWKPMQVKATPISIIVQPTTTPKRRPLISATYGAAGTARILPTNMIQTIRPRTADLGSSNASNSTGKSPGQQMPMRRTYPLSIQALSANR